MCRGCASRRRVASATSGTSAPRRRPAAVRPRRDDGDPGEANGGGQARAPNAEAQRTRAAEIDALLANDAETAHRSPLDSPKLTELYAPGGFLEGGPLGAKAQQHLWTEYHASDGGGEAASGGVTLDMLDF